MEMKSCLVCVKKLIKMGLSEGRGVQLNFPLKRGGLSRMLLRKKYCVSMRILNLFQDLFVSYLKVLVGVKNKGKALDEN